MPLVELDGVRKRFRDGPPALDGVSLAVEEGRVLVLLGTSGAGKLKASRVTLAISPASESLSTKGRSITLATSASSLACLNSSSAIDGQRSGT